MCLPARNNDPNAKHGRLKFTAQGSRFNFTIKGPDLWGAKTSGFIEMDFDTAEGADCQLRPLRSSNSYTPRLRHAMFRFNWPTSELLFGQYFSMFCEWYAESAEDGPLQMTGTPTARMAQVRFTQKFMEDWTVAGLIGDPEPGYGLDTNTALWHARRRLSTTASLRKPRSSRGKSPTPTTSGVRPPITASPLPSPFSSSAAGSATSCVGPASTPPSAFGESGRRLLAAILSSSEPVSQPLVGHGVLVHSGYPDSIRQSGRHRLHPHPVVDRPGRRGLWVYRHVWRQIPV